jgi:hypothetical protein
MTKHLSATIAAGALAASLLVMSAKAKADQVTECTTDGFCYCVRTELRGSIQQRVDEIRARVAAEKAKGKAIGYLSVPISTVGGSYFNENVKIAGEIKERVETRFGVTAAWLLNTAAPEVSLPPGATGPEYMLMWTRVLEGASGTGDFDFVFFTGPSDFARHFGLDGHGDMEKLENYYDSLMKRDEGLKAVPRRAFRDYYALRASVAYSYGSHDEWNIVRAINEKRRAADSKTGISTQMGVFFDGRQVAPGLFETPIAAGDADACRK